MNQAPLRTRRVRLAPDQGWFEPVGQAVPNQELVDYLSHHGMSVSWDGQDVDLSKCSDRVFLQTPNVPRVVFFPDEPRTLASGLDAKRHPAILEAPAVRRFIVERPDIQQIIVPRTSDRTPDTDIPLNPDQKAAFDFAVNDGDLIIEGPPGTGKSQIIAAVAADLARRSQRILITSTEPAALDVARRRLGALGLDRSDLVEVATPSQMAAGHDPPTAMGRYRIAIVDEASRMPANLAMAILTRSDRIIVIGDTRQMRPERAEKSLLDLAYDARLPRVELRYHYRSAHPALIMMSNILAYDMVLRTVPRPQLTSQHGLSTHWLLDAECDSSNGGLVNRSEALAIAGYVRQHVARRDPRTIAVITINTQQSILIKNCLKEMSDLHQSDDFYRQHWVSEPLIVRTTNAIQGEERDVVLISATYSPRPTDIKQHFGVFERAHPQERLNVMLSRARSHMQLFASFTGEDFIQPMSQGAMALNALVRGFEFLTEADLRQEPPPPLQTLARRIDFEVDHLGVVFGFRRRTLDVYHFGIVLNDDSRSDDEQRELCAQLRGFGWTIVETKVTGLTRDLQAFLRRLQQLALI